MNNMMWKTGWTACLLCVLHVASAQDIAPANTTSSNGDNELAVGIEHGGDIRGRWPVNQLKNATSVPDGGFRGNITIGTPENQLAIQTNNIVVMSCDPFSGNIQPSDVFQTAIERNVTAILLYSTSSGSCALSGTETPYNRIYTMTNTKDSNHMSSQASVDNSMALIARSETVANATGSEADGSNSSNGNSSKDNNNTNSWGPSPSTAVAMIILYSITGIITALFLIIIITGAVRAHRHPERYGPRNIIGRPRQSRARGLARAMLETLPIVRFGESHEEGRNKPTDVELAETHGPVEMVAGHEASQQTANAPREAENANSQTVPAAAAGGIAAATETSNSAPEENQGCSICTEDFAVGEDLRVLPCDHRYHPACIDPWLLNVSGTCPLCRIDLRPQASADEELDEAGNPIRREGGDMAPPLDNDNHRSSIRRSLMIGLTGIGRPERLTREERVAAIRRYTEQQRAAQAENGGAAVPVEEESSMRRRLRNAFRVRTRRTGADGQVQDVAEAPPNAAENEVTRENVADGTNPRAQS